MFYRCIVVVSMFFGAYALFVCSQSDCADTLSHVYPRGAVVTGIDYETDTVTVTDSVGFTWEFYGAEDWTEGDGCAMMMYDNGTKEIPDDEILDARPFRMDILAEYYLYSEVDKK